jgi:transposase InsO family protein
MKKETVRTLPFPYNQSKQESHNSFTQFDYFFSAMHFVTATSQVTQQHTNFANLTFFMPEPVSPNFRASKRLSALTDHLALGATLVSSTLSVQIFGAGTGAQGNANMVLTPTGDLGNYYLKQSRDASRVQWINQLWVADITYIRLKAEFVYLAVILDGFSRKVVGWALDRTLAIRLTVGALEQAIERRQPKPGLVHHSDRGLQYARGEYIALLEKHSMIPSMSRPANPYDNASCESFIKTLKREEISAHKYENLEHLRTNIEEFIDEYYNRQRLHSALGYCSPEEFERNADCQAENRGATIEVFVNKENEKKISKGLLGAGTQMPSPSPDPFSC